MASGRLVIALAEPILTQLGVPAVGATMTVYLTNTTTLAPLFSDSGLTVSITNPQVANSAGHFFVQGTSIWADATQAYDVQISLPDGELYSFTGVYLLGAAPSITGYAPINSPTFTGVPQAPTPAGNDNSAKIATTAFVQAALGLVSFIPSSMIVAFATATLPAGWLLCNGAAVSRTTYAALFGIIGTTYGVGDGSTTFNLPDLRGQFLRGLDLSRGVDSGRAIGTLQADAFQGHYHSPLSGQTSFHGDGTGQGRPTGSGSVFTNGTTGSPVADGTNGTPRTAAETRPTNVAVVYAIKT